MPDSPAGIHFRPAEERDADAIDAIEQASFAHAGERFTARKVRFLIRSPRTLVIVADEAGRIHGWVAGFAWLRGQTPWGRVYAVAVDPRVRGRSVGRKLMEQLIQKLTDAGAAEIYLEARPDNHSALRLYEKLGFVMCRSLPDFYGEGFHAIRLVRRLRPITDRLETVSS